MKCPICNTDLRLEEASDLFVAQDCNSSTEVFSNGEILWYSCLKNHSIFLEKDQVEAK